MEPINMKLVNELEDIAVELEGGISAVRAIALAIQGDEIRTEEWTNALYFICEKLEDGAKKRIERIVSSKGMVE